MTNIVMLVRGRPLLTGQALDSLYAHTREEDFNLTVVHDAKDDDFRVRKMLHGIKRKNFTLLSLESGEHVLARAKNIGVAWSEQTFGRGERLYISDNDVYFRDGWLIWMNALMNTYIDVMILGGYRHPFHGVNSVRGFSSWGSVEITDAVAGYSMLMDWQTWEQWGPFPRDCAAGVCQSEDFVLSRRVVDGGGLVGYADTPKIWNCGLTNSEGKPAIGHEQFHIEPGVLYE